MNDSMLHINNEIVLLMIAILCDRVGAIHHLHHHQHNSLTHCMTESLPKNIALGVGAVSVVAGGTAFATDEGLRRSAVFWWVKVLLLLLLLLLLLMVCISVE